MKLECKLKNLLPAINKTSKLAGKNLSLPILRCLLISTHKGKIRVEATNLEVGARFSLGGKVEKAGKIAVPADVIQSFLSLLGEDDTLILEANDSTLKISSTSSSTSIQLADEKEYPSLPNVSGQNMKIDTAGWMHGVKSVAYAASESTIKPELASVYIYEDGAKKYFVATDSFRLAEKTITTPKGVGDIPTLLIPKDNISEIINLLPEETGNIEITIADNQVSFSSSDLYLTSQIVNGNFPDYKQIIPTDLKSSATLLKSDLERALKISRIFSDKFNKITLSCDPKQKKLTITTQNSEVGESKVDLDAAIEGESLEVSFNQRYLSEAMGSFTTDSINLSLEEGKPMVVKGVGDTSFRYLVMPMST